MAVQFILGRSGSGKTHLCVESVRRELLDELHGQRLILLVPEQATFQIEQALLAGSDLRGFHRATVVSFERLARLVLNETTPPSLEPLTETAKGLLLRQIVGQLRPELRIFARTADRGGFVAQLSEMIRELRQYAKTPGDLAAAVARLDAQGAGEGPLALKLRDLARVYETYEAAIAGRFLDPDDRLDLLARRLDESRLLRDSYVWIDGFAGFTVQQYRVLEMLLQTAQHTRVSLCLDPSSRAFAQVDADPTADFDEHDLFARTLETYGRLRRIMARIAVALYEPVRLGRRGRSEPRFERCPALGLIERNFETALHRLGTPADQVVTQASLPTTGAVVVEARNRREEVEAAVRHILRLCRERGYRFREVAVVLRDIGPYRELIEASFANHGIPYFLDQRRPISRHPLVELLRCSLAMLGEEFTSEDVVTYLKTDLAGLDRETVDALENQALARGVEGLEWFATRPWPEAELEAQRRLALAPLEQLRRTLRETADPRGRLGVRELTAALVSLLDELQVARQLQGWFEADQAAGRLEDAAIHEQAYAQVVRLFDEVVETIQTARVTLGEYTEIITSALAQMTLALVPPALDQVLVGTIERSRHPEIRAALILGFNQGVWPRVPSEAGLLTEEQRCALRESGFELAPPARQDLLQERYLTYIALTRPSELLWVSYAQADGGGKALAASGLLPTLYAAGPVSLCRLDEGRTGSFERIASRCDLAVELAGTLAALEGTQMAPASVSGLFHWAMSLPELATEIKRGLAGVGWRNHANLEGDAARTLLAGYRAASVSRLECFAACPFQHFAKYLLELRTRDRLRFEAFDMGQYYHSMLERLFRRLDADGRSWDRLSDDEIAPLVEETAAALETQDTRLAALLERAGRHRFLFEVARGRVKLLVERLRDAAKAGRFRQAFAELCFGFNDAAWPALEIPAGKNRTIALHGKIDRIDLCRQEDGRCGLVVIDYKTGRSDSLKLCRVYHGLDLQLLSYVLAAQGLFDPTPEVAAALYVQVVPPGEHHDEPLRAEHLEDAADQKAVAPKARGVLNQDWLDSLDVGAEQAGASTWYGFAYKKDGTLHASRSVDVRTGEEMETLLKLTRAKLSELAGSLVGGEIAIAPYRLGNESPCVYCDYKSLCRFDFSMDEYRHLPVLDTDAILATPGGNSP